MNMRELLARAGVIDEDGAPRLTAEQLVRVLMSGELRMRQPAKKGSAQALRAPTAVAGSDGEVIVIALNDIREHARRADTLATGTRVRTTKANMAQFHSWTASGWESKKWGVEGVVIASHDSHGLCYDVRHDDGSVGYYDPEEISKI